MLNSLVHKRGAALLKSRDEFMAFFPPSQRVWFQMRHDDDVPMKACEICTFSPSSRISHSPGAGRRFTHFHRQYMSATQHFFRLHGETFIWPVIWCAIKPQVVYSVGAIRSGDSLRARQPTSLLTLRPVTLATIKTRCECLHTKCCPNTFQLPYAL